MRQFGMTVITEIRENSVLELTQLLNQIGDDIQHNPVIDFPAMRRIHFMRWVVVPENHTKRNHIAPQLVLSTNYDGEAEAHVREMVTTNGAGLMQIYRHCEGVPEKVEDLVEYLLSHRRENAAFYAGTQGRTVQRIQQEAELNGALQDRLQTTNPLQDWPNDPTTLYSELRAFALEKFPWAREKFKLPELVRRGSWWLGLEIVLVLALYAGSWFLSVWLGLGLTLAFVLFFTVFWLQLRKQEKQDARNFKRSKLNSRQIAYLNQREDHQVQNQITHLVTVKPGWVRQFALRGVLYVINLLAKYHYNKGNLAGITSIHFARWVLIDNGRRLLFFSNYDGSWESYLGEFVDRAAIGLTGVWSNTEGYPPTSKLVMAGARQSEIFKVWTRTKQIETQVWYSAYKTLSVTNILNNSDIHQGITEALPREKQQLWLNKL